MPRARFCFMLGLVGCGAERALPFPVDGGAKDLSLITPDQMGVMCTGRWTPPSVPCAGMGACDDGNNCTYNDRCDGGQCQGIQFEDCTRPCRTNADCCGGGLKPEECSTKYHLFVEYELVCGLLGCKSRSTNRPCQ